MSNLPKPVAIVSRYSSGFFSGCMRVLPHSLDLPHGTKLFTEAQLLTAVGEAVHELRKQLISAMLPVQKSAERKQADELKVPALPEPFVRQGAPFPRSIHGDQAPDDLFTLQQVYAIRADAYGVGFKRAAAEAAERRQGAETLAKTKCTCFVPGPPGHVHYCTCSEQKVDETSAKTKMPPVTAAQLVPILRLLGQGRGAAALSYLRDLESQIKQSCEHKNTRSVSAGIVCVDCGAYK